MRSDRVTAVVLVGVGLFIWLEAQRYGALSKLFPQVVAVALVLLAVILLLHSFRRRGRRAAAVQRSERARGERPDVRGVALSLLIITAWTVLLEPLGFWTASVAAFAVLVAILRTPEQTPAVVWKTVFAGVLLVTVFVLIFRITLRVPLPEGLFW